jgi:hypothetical protein
MLPADSWPCEEEEAAALHRREVVQNLRVLTPYCPQEEHDHPEVLEAETSEVADHRERQTGRYCDRNKRIEKGDS